MNTQSLAGVTGVAAIYTVGVAVAPAAAFDYQGVSFVIGALSVLLGSIVTSGLAIGTYLRAGRAVQLAAQLALDQKATHDLVDGKMEALKGLIEKKAFAEGEKAGIEAEREKPMVPAPPLEKPL